MFLPPFEGPALKLERARLHYADLLITLANYQDRAKPVFVKAEQPPHDWTIEISESVPPVVSLQIGDIAHSLRSSLDVMLCDIALVRNVGLSDMAYPFAKDEMQFEKMLRDSNKKQPFKKLGSEIVDIIEQSRPYKGGQWELRGLHDLNNQDKHRMIVPYTSFVRCTGNYKSMFGKHGLSVSIIGGPLVGFYIGDRVNIDERYVRHPSEEFSINSTSMIVCFAPGFVLSGNVIDVMAEIIDYVDNLLERLQMAATR